MNTLSNSRRGAVFASLASLALAGCMSAPTLPPPATAAPATTTQSPPAAAPSTLSYGLVTTQVQKGKTTQADLLQTFGGPNIATTDRDGTETWVYERTATQTDVQANTRAAQGTASLGAFFKYIDLQAGGSVGTSASASSTSSSVRSLTVIVKFAADKTVADYSVRASTF